MPSPASPIASGVPVGCSAAPAPAMNLADLLVAYLEQLGVEHVFGVPGGLIEPFYDALARSQRRGSISHVLARHEAGAAFMADGYARETGRLGVCCSTAGPGATNLITGVACAHDNGVPLLVITGEPALANQGRHALQESMDLGVDTRGMFSHCTRYSSQVSHPNQFERKLFAALQHVTRAPQGPAHLSVPVDVFRSSAELPSCDLRTLLAPAGLVDEAALAQLRQRLAQACKVVLVVGGGCGAAIGLVLQFAERIGASIVTTPDGKGLVSPQHPLLRGVFGFAGHASAEAALADQAVDLILAIGTSLGEWNSGGWSTALLNRRLVHVDDSEAHLALSHMAQLHVRGHLPSVFARLTEDLAQSDAATHGHRRALRRQHARDQDRISLSAPDKFVSAASPIKPQRLMRELGLRLPPDTRFLADTGNSVAWAIHYLQPANDRRRGERRRQSTIRNHRADRRPANGSWLRVTMNFAPMGWAIGAAVGTAVANPEAPVVCITGDGSLLMNGQELSVAVAAQLPVIFVVLNDASLGMVRHGQRLAGAEAIGCELPPTDFAAMARAMGAQGCIVQSPADLEALDFNELCTRPGPTLLDVRIDPEEVPPMSVRMRVLAEIADQ